MSSITQNVICGICKRLIVFDVPKAKHTSKLNMFVTNSCIWSDKGVLQYMRYINGITYPVCFNLRLEKHILLKN